MTPLPAIVISGFLGAGKTTLLNRLLASELAGTKIGVIVNDFGKLNIDGRLVRSGESPLLELSGGCVCCSLQLGLHEAVRTLSDRGDLDLLVIEASGISVSSALLHVLESPELADSVRLCNVVVVVDARRYSQVLHSLPVIRDQVAHANVIVLNHCDEVDAATVDAAKHRLAQDNARAPIMVSEYGNIAFKTLLNEVRLVETDAHRSHDHGRWYAYEVLLSNDIDAGAVLALTNQLSDKVERVKGFVARGGALHSLQKVGPFPASLECCAEQPTEPSRNVLVILAREPIEGELRQTFANRAVVTAT